MTRAPRGSRGVRVIADAPRFVSLRQRERVERSLGALQALHDDSRHKCAALEEELRRCKEELRRLRDERTQVRVSGVFRKGNAQATLISCSDWGSAWENEHFPLM